MGKHKKLPKGVITVEEWRKRWEAGMLRWLQSPHWRRNARRKMRAKVPPSE